MSEPIKCRDCAYRNAYLTYLDNLDTRTSKLFAEVKAAVTAAKELSHKVEQKNEVKNDQG